MTVVNTAIHSEQALWYPFLGMFVDPGAVLKRKRQRRPYNSLPRILCPEDTETKEAIALSVWRTCELLVFGQHRVLPIIGPGRLINAQNHEGDVSDRCREWWVSELLRTCLRRDTRSHALGTVVGV